MSKDLPYKQDMPPKSGYAKVQVDRIPTWTPKGWKIGLAVMAFIPFAYWDYKKRMKKMISEMVLDDEGRACLEPLVLAESDRLLLWQLRRNREEENKLMKDVPGWKTGTLFGEPIYKTNPNLDKWIHPTVMDVYAHTRERDAVKAISEHNNYL